MRLREVPLLRLHALKTLTTEASRHYSKYQAELRVTVFCWFAVFALRKADQRPRSDATPKLPVEKLRTR